MTRRLLRRPVVSIERRLRSCGLSRSVIARLVREASKDRKLTRAEFRALVARTVKGRRRS